MAWKLALVAAGRSGDCLLDTYEAERRPIAREVLASTSAMTGMVLGQTAWARALRDHVFVPLLNRPLVQRRLWEKSSQLTLTYRRGPLGTGRHLPGSAPRPGDRVPDRACVRRDGTATRLYEELRAGWALLTPGVASADHEAVARRRLGADHVTTLTVPESRQHTLLVRPDAHLAWRGTSPAALDKALARILDIGTRQRASRTPGGGTHMSTSPTPTPGLRERKKAQTRRTIQEQALRLFLSQGYQNTTVEEICAAAGVSHMTFFRHFPTKEAVVESDDYDPLIARLIQERPPHEDSLTALRNALGQGLEMVYATGKDALLVRTRLILDTPALRARTWDNQYSTQRLFADALRSRNPDESDLSTRVAAAAALAAVTTALASWVESNGAIDLPALVDEAFRALRPA